MRVLLYTTLGCHLCDDALALLHKFDIQHGKILEIQEIEISESDSLVETYGVRIPVIQKQSSEKELGWPFTLDDLIAYLENDGPPGF
jgi:hypothetical protein